MEDKIYYCNLYDCYEGLLTEKQSKYFKDYYLEDLSLSEISENYEISRNAAFHQIKETKKKLNHYEKILKLYNKKEKIKNITKNIDEDIKRKIEEILEG